MSSVPITVTSVNSWIVFQQNIDMSVSFNRSWTDYKNGFGNHDGNLWLGLKNIRQLILNNIRPCQLRVELLTTGGRWFSAEYATFTIENENNLYRIHVGGYSGDAGDLFNAGISGGSGNVQNGMAFSTFDSDNDLIPTRNCAGDMNGFWYNACTEFNPNGDANHPNIFASHLEHQWTGLSKSRMMMKLV